MSERLYYRGYTGTIEIDPEDLDSLHGQVLFINDTLIYSGTTASEIEENFRESVDQYLADCSDLKRKPNEPKAVLETMSYYPVSISNAKPTDWTLFLCTAVGFIMGCFVSRFF